MLEYIAVAWPDRVLAYTELLVALVPSTTLLGHWHIKQM